MTAGYVVDLLGGAIEPISMAAVAAFALGGSVWAMRGPREGGIADGERVAAVMTAIVVIAALAYFLWLASPSMLPVTNGPDVVHHLVLIHLIERTHHLVHGSALNAYLLEMAAYTPGSHILGALAARWLRVDAVRVVHPIAAACAAIGLGLVYVVTFRAARASRRAAWQSCAAPLLALVPASYTIGAFMHFFFFAQVVAGTFALGVLAAAAAWPRLGRQALIWCSLCAAGLVLSWPVWIVPPAFALVTAGVVRRGVARGLGASVLTLLPAAVLFAIHALRHPQAGGIITTSGAIISPSMALFGAGFVTCAIGGVVMAIVMRRTPAAIAFAAATVLEAAALTLLNRAEGSSSLYLPFKMVFLLVPPAAVFGAIALCGIADVLVARLPRIAWTAAIVPPLLAAMLLPGRVPTRRERGSITEPALAAGLWARDHLPPACLDYFSGYWLTGYWLHIDVLGNPRASERMRTETFELRDVVAKWIEGRGLPYAFVEDMDAVPKDAREDMAAVQRFGGAAIVHNLRPATCADTSPSLWTIIKP